MQPRDTKEPMFLEKWRVLDTKEVSTNPEAGRQAVGVGQ